MNIVEATEKALEKGVGIKNPRYKNTYLLPTNTTECYLVIPVDFAIGNGTHAAPRWNPHAEDILANDWELYSSVE